MLLKFVLVLCTTICLACAAMAQSNVPGGLPGDKPYNFIGYLGCNPNKDLGCTRCPATGNHVVIRFGGPYTRGQCEAFKEEADALGCGGVCY